MSIILNSTIPRCQRRNFFAGNVDVPTTLFVEIPCHNDKVGLLRFTVVRFAVVVTWPYPSRLPMNLLACFLSSRGLGGYPACWLSLVGPCKRSPDRKGTPILRLARRIRLRPFIIQQSTYRGFHKSSVAAPGPDSAGLAVRSTWPPTRAEVWPDNGG